MAGKDKSLDMTTGSIWRNMVAFAVPVFLGQLFQQLYNTADSIIVGNFSGKDALAAVASSGNLIFMMTGFFMGLSLGAGVVISRYFGAKDYKAMEAAVHTNIAFGAVCGVLMSVLGIFLAPQLLIIMNTPEDVLPLSTTYFRLYFLGAFFSLMYNTCMGILRAVGDSKTPLYYLIFSSVVNVVFDLIFVGPLQMGVAGAAIATVISQAVSAVMCFIKLLRSTGPERVVFRNIRFDMPMLRQIAGQGIPSGVQNSIISIANVVVQSNINAFGADAMAGCGTYSKLEGFAFLPITCFTMALTTFVSQNLGAHQYDRVKRGVRFGILSSVTMAEVIGALIFLFSPALIALFQNDPPVIAIGVKQAHIEAFFYSFLAFSHCIAAIMRGACKQTVHMIVMLAVWCVLRVSYISIGGPMMGRIEVVFSAYPLTWFTSSVIFLIYFLKSDWLHNYDRLEQKKALL